MVGDIVVQEVDVLISTGNVWLNMSGGVNGEILRRGNRALQEDLHSHLQHSAKKFVEQGTIIALKPGTLPVSHILYTVAVDTWYNSSVEVVAQIIEQCLDFAEQHGARTVALPALATGYGKLTMRDFARGLQRACATARPSLDELRVVLRTQHDRSVVENILHT